VAMNFDALWHVIVSRLIGAHRSTDSDAVVFPASKKGALSYLDNLKRRVELMEDFKEFPEGDPGVVVFALLWDRAGEASDGGEFAHDCHGLTNLIEKFRHVAGDENPWHTLPPDW